MVMHRQTSLAQQLAVKQLQVIYNTIRKRLNMKQQTTQDNANLEILNVATLSEDERVRTVVNEAIQVQIIRSDVGYIVDILDANGGLIETNTVWDDDLENDENED